MSRCSFEFSHPRLEKYFDRTTLLTFFIFRNEPNLTLAHLEFIEFEGMNSL